MIRCLMVALLSPTVVNAATYQSAESLRKTVEDFLTTQTAQEKRQDIEISIGRVDQRLKLVSCTTQPQAFLAPGAQLQGKLTVGLRCAGPKPWTVYIPAQIKRYAEVIAAARPLLRGAEIRAGDVMPVRLELSRLRNGYFSEAKNVLGKILTRNIASGQAITPKRVKAPILVHRGEKVNIIATAGALKVRGKGKALRDAAQGELVSVRNIRSKRIVQGIVTKPGTVHVQM